MKITESEVLHVARLARLELDEKEVAVFRRDLNAILDYMDMLTQVDTCDIGLSKHSSPVHNVLRQDCIVQSQSLDEALANAPQVKDGAVVVPKVIE